MQQAAAPSLPASSALAVARTAIFKVDCTAMADDVKMQKLTTWRIDTVCRDYGLPIITQRDRYGFGYHGTTHLFSQFYMVT